MTLLRDIFPHLLAASDVAGTGPAPWVVCSRPTCHLAYRTLAHARVVTPPCPACGQPYVPAKAGPRLTRAQREAMA